MLGAILMIGADTLARTIVAPAEMPIGILTAAVGAPFFLADPAAATRADRTMSAILQRRRGLDAIGDARLVDGVDLDIPAARWSRSSARTAPANRRCCACCPATCARRAGSVQLRGRDIARLSAARTGARIARCCRSMFSVTFPFTVEEIVEMGAGERSRARVTAAGRCRAATKSGSTPFRDRQLPTLSGGEQQRAHFARVLVQLACGEAMHGPGVLLLDEPTSSLDLRHQIDLVESARRRAQSRHRRDRDPARPQPRHALCRPHRAAAPRPPRRRRRPPLDHHLRRIRELFEVDVAIRHTDDGVPYLLPQTMQPAAVGRQ